MLIPGTIGGISSGVFSNLGGLKLKSVEVSTSLSPAAAGVGDHPSWQAKVSNWRRCILRAEASASHSVSLPVWQARPVQLVFLLVQ